MSGEYARSQEVLGGNFKPRGGNLATLNTRWDIFEKLNLGGEGYIVQSRYATTFSSPVHPRGDAFGSGKYLYSLIEDNDDGDDYPENGKSKLNAVPEGDPDGTISEKYDKDKNGRFDFEEDFLNYDADPPKSKLYFDRNNNGVPDEIEDDAYPNYPYLPGYYLPGERYLRYNDMTGQWDEGISDGQVSKGISGLHLNGQYQLLPKLSLTVGWVAEKSERKSFQMTYRNGAETGLVLASEKATTLYSLINYRHDLADDMRLTVDNYLRYVRDNIPNHTQTFTFDTLTEGLLNYHTVEDRLDLRDAAVEMLIAEYSIYRSRGFNLTTRANYEFQKHFPHLDFNYADRNISSLILVNKCEYIYLLPFLKDMFLIPRYKNLYEFTDCISCPAPADEKNERNNMLNAAYLVYEWKFTKKTSITTGVQFTTFNDFMNDRENYYHGNWTIQLMLKDRYFGLNMILTTGFAKYKYVFYNAPDDEHTPLYNPYRIDGNISSYDVFLKVHCGF